MDSQVKIIEQLLYDKILLYQELVESLKAEQGYLTRADVDALWEVSARKRGLVSAIESVRVKILRALSDISTEHGPEASSFSLSAVMSQIAYAERSLLRKPYLTLVGLKTQTRELSAENKVFIEESLAFLDEIIGVIAGSRDDNSLYDGGGAVRAKKGHSNLLFCREV